MTVNGHGNRWLVNSLIGFIGILMGSMTTMYVSDENGHDHPVLIEQIKTINKNIETVQTEQKEHNDKFIEFKVDIIKHWQVVKTDIEANSGLRADIRDIKTVLHDIQHHQEQEE